MRLPDRQGAAVVVFFAVYGFFCGCLSLSGWIFDVRRLTDWDNDSISIQPNACLAAAALGAALLFAVYARHRTAIFTAAIVTVLGALTAIENLFAINFGIDRILLFGREWGSTATTAPGRMGIPASLSFAVLGACLLLTTARSTPAQKEWAPWLALLPLAISTLSILGYIYGSSLLYAVPGLTAIALQTATYVFALSIAVVASSDSGPMKLFGDDGPAGIAARQLLPFIFAVPVVTGAFRLAGERAGLYDTAFGVALHNVVEIALLLVLILLTGRAIMRHSQQREEAEEERQELLASEKAARLEAERQATIRDEFLATLSHELRTPLNAIQGWAQILRLEGGGSERVEEAVDVIERNARLQGQLIADLLDMSRILAGKMRLHVQPLDLAAVASDAIDVVQPAADAKNIRIEKLLEPIGTVVNGDAGRLQQAIWNLLTNAVRFTPRHGKVQIVLTRVDSQVEIRVSDTGKGIETEFLPKIFERFRQVDASPARQHDGIGLGLALVKQIVEFHGGEVSAASEGLGKGSTFSILLPLAIMQPAVTAQRVHPLSDAPQASGEPLPSLDGLSILIVDDDADSLRMVANLFGDRGATTVTSNNAALALETALAQDFDVIVSDIGMPGRDGYELIRDLRAQGITAPAVALTAYARSGDRTKALSSGYQSHVAKPVETAELLATVASLARRPTTEASPRTQS